MAVFKAPVRQQSYLTEYDKQMAQYLRQMSGSIGAQDIAAEAYGGKFPVGTMTAKILGSVLARASDKRAMNREERAKDSYSRAFEIANAQDRGLNLSTTDMSVSPEGNLEILPTNVEGGGVSTFTRPETYGETLKNYKSSGIADEQFFEDREKISAEDALAAQFARDNLNKLTGRRVPGVEATTEAPLGIPYAPQNVALTVGEKTPEDSTQLSRYLSGTLEQDVLPTNANKALSQALRGANVPKFQFDEYRQNKRIQDMANARAEEKYQYELANRNNIKYGDSKTFYGNNTQVQAGLVTLPNGNSYYSPIGDNGFPTMQPLGKEFTSSKQPEQEAREVRLSLAQINELNKAGLNIEENAGVEIKLKKDFDPTGKTAIEIYNAATSIDVQEKTKGPFVINTGDMPKALNDKLRSNIANSVGIIGEGATLIQRIEEVPSVVGVKGKLARGLGGIAGIFDSVAETDYERAVTQYFADADPEELSRTTADIRQYVAKSISAITGEESGRYTEAEQDLARKTIAAEVGLGTPAAVYGALISIMSIEERSRDRAITAIARNKAIKSGEPFKYNIPLITDEEKVSYMKYLQKLGFDKNSALNLIDGIQLDRDVADRGGY